MVVAAAFMILHSISSCKHRRIISDMELASKNEKERHNREYQKLHKDAIRRINDLKGENRCLQQKNGVLMEQKAHLIRTLESCEKQCEALASKMQAMEGLNAQQAKANSGSYGDAVDAQLRSAHDALKATVASFSTDLFNEFIRKLPESNDAVEHLLMTAHSFDAAAMREVINDRQKKKMDRRARFLLCKLILQAICCQIFFCDFEVFHIHHRRAAPLFQKPKEVQKAFFKEYETCREMSPEQLLESNSSFAGFLQWKANGFVETLKFSLFSEAHPTWMQQGHLIFQVPDSAVSKGFVRMTKAAWLLLNLAFSFEPTAEVLRVSMGSVFNADYMEDMMMLQAEEGYGSVHDGHSTYDDDMVVTIMCFPGFTVRNTIIKSGVCLI